MAGVLNSGIQAAFAAAMSVLAVAATIPAEAMQRVGPSSQNL